jgi:starvation-inducible DNA-binding protein
MTQTGSKPEIRQQPGAVGDNSINLKQKTTRELIEALNAHVASLFMLFHQYQKHHWVVEGPQFRDLHLLLEEHYTAVHLQADEFAERIVTLGGVPVGGPSAHLKHAYIKEEPEGVLDLRQMLSNDLRANQQILERLRADIKRANDLGDFGTEHLLKRHLRQQELRTQDLMHLLEHETLDEVLADESEA